MINKIDKALARLSKKRTKLQSHKIIGLAKKFVPVFPLHLTEKNPNKYFGQPNRNEKGEITN